MEESKPFLSVEVTDIALFLWKGLEAVPIGTDLWDQK